MHPAAEPLLDQGLGGVPGVGPVGLEGGPKEAGRGHEALEKPVQVHLGVRSTSRMALRLRARTWVLQHKKGPHAGRAARGARNKRAPTAAKAA